VTWRCIVDSPRDGAANMAIDQALFEGVQAGDRPVLRLYRWQPPCLSLGRNQSARGIYDPDLARRRGIDIVRRPTGGLAVFHDRELTYTVAAQVTTLGRPRPAYAAINSALASGVDRMGASVTIAPHRPAPGPLVGATHPCFGHATVGEVTADGRKLVGSAMRFENRTILQHGSILIDGDQSEVVSLQVRSPAGSMTLPPPITLREVLGRVPDWPELYTAVLEGFTAMFGTTFEASRPTDAECGRARDLEAHYRNEAWTWRM
jgi:lipoate-protein ligase A